MHFHTWWNNTRLHIQPFGSDNQNMNGVKNATIDIMRGLHNQCTGFIIGMKDFWRATKKINQKHYLFFTYIVDNVLFFQISLFPNLPFSKFLIFSISFFCQWFVLPILQITFSPIFHHHNFSLSPCPLPQIFLFPNLPVFQITFSQFIPTPLSPIPFSIFPKFSLSHQPCLFTTFPYPYFFCFNFPFSPSPQLLSLLLGV